MVEDLIDLLLGERRPLELLFRHLFEREGEFLSNVLTGWNFGDGHCLDERLIAAWQERCQYEPGDVVAVFTEFEVHVPMEWAVIGLLFCTLVGLAAGMWPAIRASRLQPIEALQQE